MQRRGERVRKECELRRRGRGTGCRGRVRIQRGQVVFVCVGWGRKWVRLVFLFMALMPAVLRGAARLLPLQGIARGGGRVRNRAESSDGKERGLFWVSGGHWSLVWPSIGAVQTRRRSIRCPSRSVATGSAIIPAAMIRYRRVPAVGMPKLLMRSALADFGKTQSLQNGYDF